MNLQKNIRKVLKEWYVTIDREERMGMTYDNMEKIIDKVMSKNYDWWKGIELESVIYSEISDNIELYGVLKVDKKWGKMMWKKERGYKIPEDNGRIFRMDDIVSGEIEKEISNSLTMIFIGTTNFQKAIRTRIGVLKLKFV
jgi:hypothetical protein